jgi:hypothetical protein
MMKEVDMSIRQSPDRSANRSLVYGVYGALLTAAIHFGTATSKHFDFLIRDAEFYIVLGTILIIMALSILDFRQGMHAMRHMQEPHGKHARTMALAGMTLGVADLLPALIILAIMIETFLLKFAQIGPLFNF